MLVNVYWIFGIENCVMDLHMAKKIERRSYKTRVIKKKIAISNHKV